MVLVYEIMKKLMYNNLPFVNPRKEYFGRRSIMTGETLW